MTVARKGKHADPVTPDPHLRPQKGAPDASLLLSRKDIGVVLGLGAAAVTLFWWTSTDRLDLPKEWVFLFSAVVAMGYAWFRHRKEESPPPGTVLALVMAPVVAWAVAPAGMGARVEGWAGWVAAVCLVWVARRACARTLAIFIYGIGVTVAAVAWLQALGLPLLNGGLEGLEGRRVVATLGGPGHLGWWLTAALPWCLVAIQKSLEREGKELPGFLQGWLGKRSLLVGAHGTALALLFGAWVFSGSRVAWGAGGLVMAFWVWRAWPGWRVSRPRSRSRRWMGLVVAGSGLLGVGAALATDACTQKAQLKSRAADLGKKGGTARGRLYLWQVHLSSLDELPLLGSGPEAFQRSWPKLQEAYLRAHPQAEPFRSDLRHAHADVVEIYHDFGILGLLLGIWVMFCFFKGPPTTANPPRQQNNTATQIDEAKLSQRQQHTATLGCALALLVSGLGAPVLFFAPTLFLGALALGVALGPQRVPQASQQHGDKKTKKEAERASSPNDVPGNRASPGRVACYALCLTALGLTLVPLTKRLVSEVVRSSATRARLGNHPSRAARHAKDALRIDPRNPRAAMELGVAMEILGRPKEALGAWRKAARDLPTDEVRDHLASLEAGDLVGDPPSAPPRIQPKKN